MGYLKNVKYGLFLFFFLISVPVFAWDKICSIGHEALFMTSAQLSDFHKENIKGYMLEGRGHVIDVTRRGINKEYFVKIGCGSTSVIVEVSTTGNCDDLIPGQIVDFYGNGVSSDRRRYVDTQQPYMFFELNRGSVR